MIHHYLLNYLFNDLVVDDLINHLLNDLVVDEFLEQWPGFEQIEQRTHVPGMPADGGFQSLLVSSGD